MDLTFPDSLIHWLLVGASAAGVGFLGAALSVYFERTPRPAWVLALHYGSLAIALLEFAGVVFLAPRSDPWVAAAIVMYTIAMAVFLSAIEAGRRTRLQRSFIDHPLPSRLISDGPFRWVRHPFCTGYLLGALAAPVGIQHPAMILVAASLAAVTICAAVREERVWLSSPRADEYREYRRRTGMFIPFVGRG